VIKTKIKMNLRNQEKIVRRNKNKKKKLKKRDWKD